MSLKLKSVAKGSQIIDQIFWELFKLLQTKQGLTERDVARQIKKLAKKMGASGMAFPPIVAFGRNSAEIHHFAQNRRIGKNNFLMLDYGVKVNGYCSDFTRTLFLGRPTKFHEKIYNIVLKSQLQAIKKIRIGAISDEIDFTARHAINQTGYGRNFTHGTGHGVGKQIHEAPSFKINTNDRVKKDDVVTIEPGIYLPGKFGYRIEDMIVVGSKARVLSIIPKDFRSMIV